jgi:hypothetical protein
LMEPYPAARMRAWRMSTSVGARSRSEPDA